MKPTKKAAGKGPQQQSQMVVTGGNMELLPLDGKNVPDYIQKGDKRGTENLGMGDLVIPRLEIVQGLSPAVKKGDPGFIEGATAGQLNNSVSRQLYGESVWVIPADYSVQYLVWRDRKMVDAHNANSANRASKLPTDGGFFGAYPDAHKAKERADLEGGEKSCIVVVDTPTHLCLLLNAETGEPEEVMVPMPRTKAKVSRQWNTLVKMAGGPRFSRAYEVKTVLQKNAQGDFYNFAIQPVGFPPKQVYQRAEALYEAMQKGRVVTMDVTGLDPSREGEHPDDTRPSKM